MTNRIGGRLNKEYAQRKDLDMNDVKLDTVKGPVSAEEGNEVTTSASHDASARFLICPRRG